MTHTLSLITSIAALPFAIYCLFVWFKSDDDKWATFSIGLIATVVHLINIMHGGI